MPYKVEFTPCEINESLVKLKGYYVRVIGLSCYSHGNTLEEAETNIIEALTCHLC